MQFLAAIDHLDNLRVVLVSTRNPLNIGAAARAMCNFGVAQLRVVNPYEPSYREARSAVGAVELLRNSKDFKSVQQAVADCSLVIGTTAVRDRDLQHSVRTLAAAAPLIRKRLASGNVALLFGSERHGLTNDDLSHCHWLLNIPTREQQISMNLGQAVAVCLYEIVRKGRIPSEKTETKPANAGELDRLGSALLEALLISGYLKPGADAINEEKMRRLLRRVDLNSADAEVLTGMMHKIGWKLRSKS